MDLYGGMFLKSEVRDVIHDRPVRFEIIGTLKNVAILIRFPSGVSLSFILSPVSLD